MLKKLTGKLVNLVRESRLKKDRKRVLRVLPEGIDFWELFEEFEVRQFGERVRREKKTPEKEALLQEFFVDVVRALYNERNSKKYLRHLSELRKDPLYSINPGWTTSSWVHTLLERERDRQVPSAPTVITILRVLAEQGIGEAEYERGPFYKLSDRYIESLDQAA